MSLKEVIMLEGITKIGSIAFGDCSNLISVLIPGTVTTTNPGTAPFENCSSLKNIIIEDGVTHIGVGTFSSCTSLKEITIPKSVIKFGISAFADCSSLITINYTGTEEEWNAIVKETGWDFDTPSNKIINYNYRTKESK